MMAMEKRADIRVFSERKWKEREKGKGRCLIRFRYIQKGKIF